jgi:hypothetical protein
VNASNLNEPALFCQAHSASAFGLLRELAANQRGRKSAHMGMELSAVTKGLHQSPEQSPHVNPMQGCKAERTVH